MKNPQKCTFYKHDWVDLDKRAPLYGIRVKPKGYSLSWAFCAEDDKPLLFDTEAARDAVLKALRKAQPLLPDLPRNPREKPMTDRLVEVRFLVDDYAGAVLVRTSGMLRGRNILNTACNAALYRVSREGLVLRNPAGSIHWLRPTTADELEQALVGARCVSAGKKGRQ